VLVAIVDFVTILAVVTVFDGVYMNQFKMTGKTVMKYRYLMLLNIFFIAFSAKGQQPEEKADCTNNLTFYFENCIDDINSIQNTFDLIGNYKEETKFFYELYKHFDEMETNLLVFNSEYAVNLSNSFMTRCKLSYKAADLAGLSKYISGKYNYIPPHLLKYFSMPIKYDERYKERISRILLDNNLNRKEKKIIIYGIIKNPFNSLSMFLASLYEIYKLNNKCSDLNKNIVLKASRYIDVPENIFCELAELNDKWIDYSLMACLSSEDNKDFEDIWKQLGQYSGDCFFKELYEDYVLNMREKQLLLSDNIDEKLAYLREDVSGIHYKEIVESCFADDNLPTIIELLKIEFMNKNNSYINVLLNKMSIYFISKEKKYTHFQKTIINYILNTNKLLRCHVFKQYKTLKILQHYIDLSKIKNNKKLMFSIAYYMQEAIKYNDIKAKSFCFHIITGCSSRDIFFDNIILRDEYFKFYDNCRYKFKKSHSLKNFIMCYINDEVLRKNYIDIETLRKVKYQQ
jgi:hypothetical protein